MPLSYITVSSLHALLWVTHFFWKKNPVGHLHGCHHVENRGEDLDNEILQIFIRTDLSFHTGKAHWVSNVRVKIDPHQGQSPVNFGIQEQEGHSIRFYKGSRIKMASDFSTAVLGTRTQGSCFQSIKENDFQPRILYLAKPLIKQM